MDMFLAQYNENSLYYLTSLLTLLLSSFLPKNLPYQVVEKVETKFEL